MDKPVSEPTAPAELSPSLERENEQFRMESGRIDAIVSASNRMAKDAERYRWLRERCVRGMALQMDGTQVWMIQAGKWPRAINFDAAIDAAMKG